ncbi:MAG: DUF4129 domain-containing protein [Luteibacter sp.]
MEIERISVALRVRTARESMDLGVAMLRQHARPIFIAWFIVSLPFLAAAIALEVWLGRPWIPLLFVWWMKPLFARIPLYVVSRAVFAEAPGWREALRSVWAWGLKGMWGWLTFRRLDPRRSVLQPIIYLEGLDRQAQARRWKVFGRGVEGPGTALMLTCVMFEWVLALSLLLFLPMFIPSELWESYWVNSWYLKSMPHWLAIPLIVAWYLGMSVAEPLCTTGGFAMYLGRRTELEAWDLDLAFRRLRDRLVAAGTVAALLLAIGIASTPVNAADVPHAVKPEAASMTLSTAFPAPADGTDTRMARVSAKVMADPLLGGKGHELRWSLKHPPKVTPPAERERDEPALADDRGGAGLAVKTVLIAVLIVGVGWLAWFALRRWPTRGIGRVTVAAAARAPSRIDTSTVAPAAGKGFGDEAGRLWQIGSRREALALLYRGTVEHVSARLDEPVPADATEADAIAGAQRLGDDDASRRAIRIVRTWQYAAYADRYPSDDDMAALLTGWPVERA